MNLRRLFLVFATFSFFFTSCNKELKIDVPDGISEPAVRNFIYKYGENTDVKWTKRGNYNVAIFHTSPVVKAGENRLTTIWYTNQGVDVQFTQEIPFNSLPEAVKTGFSNAVAELGYSAWEVDDDADIVVRLGLDYIYIIEIENGDRERELSFSNTGILLKDVVDDNEDDEVNYIDPKFLTEDMRQALLALFPNSQYVSLLEIDLDDNYIIVDIIDGTIHKEVTFDNAFNWISIKYETTLLVAKTVMNNVNDAIFTNLVNFGKENNIDFTDVKVQNNTEVEILQHFTNGYSFEVEYNNNGTEYELSIDSEGNILRKIDY